MSKQQVGQGRFIAVEGVDGAGKGVQCAFLLSALQSAGLDVLLTREPGGSPGAEQIRELVVNGSTDKWDDMTELLLIYAARRSHLQQTILPAIARGTWVISDRFADSSRAFQGIAGGLGLQTVETLHQLVIGNFAPDLTIVLDLEPEASLARTRQRGGGEDRFEKKGVGYQQRVREGFRQLALASPATHVLIDAAGSMDAVRKRVFDAVNKHLGLELPS
jgi:dTMP kinase